MSGLITVTTAGAQPQTPAALNAELLANASALSPGLTGNLPPSMVTDLGGTGTGALIVCDQAAVELVNSLTPAGANLFLLTQLGQIYGVPAGIVGNASVGLIFTGTPGFPIGPGFTVSDGTHQYVVQDGGSLASGTTAIITAVATQSGSWAIPPNSVTQFITSVPSTITLSVTNPLAGVPPGAPQTPAQYRAAVMQAGAATAQGATTFVRTLLANVPGVQASLISVRMQPGAWEIIVGGSGDPNAIAYAIFQAMFWIPGLTGSTLGVVAITNANPGVVTTDLNHGYTSGQTVAIAGAVPSNYNGSFTATVLSPTQFSIGVDTTSFPPWQSGGTVAPNFRNTSGTVVDYPDVYTIPFVLPPLQAVTMVVTWNTLQAGYIADSTVATDAAQPLADYVNSLYPGQPLNLLDMDAIFQAAVVAAIPTPQLSKLIFAVTINGILTAPTGQLIIGDPESFFNTTAAAITIQRG